MAQSTGREILLGHVSLDTTSPYIIPALTDRASVGSSTDRYSNLYRRRNRDLHIAIRGNASSTNTSNFRTS